MDILFFFSVAGVAIVILILKFDKKQTIKVNTVLKETRSVPPLLLLKATEQKISTLRNALSFNDTPQNMAGAASMTNIYNAQKDNASRYSKVQQFKLLSAKYNSGLMSLENYNAKLDELLEQVQSNSGAFGLAS
ncbi:MAG: hypothetical protein JWQ84_1554 [Mucilaginibacter sp.]|jgi:hypothetical protein|nr:hypothetical protein [Mucilaginibacter sp.]MDB5140479.1 hypothetical protein [Mucilaginibacter sp.]